MSHILILEDHPETRAWLESVVTKAFPGDTFISAGNIAQAQRLAEQHHCSIALVDLNLPDGSGVDFIRWLLPRNPDVYIVVATIYDDDQHLFSALKAGAHGYLLKEEQESQIIEALRNIATGQPPLTSAIARKILRHFQSQIEDSQPQEEEVESQVPDAETTEPLTERELDVLRLVSKGYSRSEVALFLGITANTAASHVKNIYRKLNISSKVEAVLEAQRLGLL